LDSRGEAVFGGFRRPRSVPSVATTVT